MRSSTERLATLPDGGARVRGYVADLNASALVRNEGIDTRLMHDASTRNRYQPLVAYLSAHPGRDVVTYVPPGADETPEASRVAFARYAGALREAPSPVLGPLCLCLDLLSIHPFEDGDGRVTRLLLLYLLQANGPTQALHPPYEGIVSRNRLLLDSATRRSMGVRYYETYEQFRPAPFLVASLGLLAASYDALERVEGQRFAPATR